MRNLIPLGDLMNAWTLGIIPRPARVRLPTQEEFDDEVERELIVLLERARKIKIEAIAAGVDTDADNDHVRERTNALAAFRRRRQPRSTP